MVLSGWLHLGFASPAFAFELASFRLRFAAEAPSASTPSGWGCPLPSPLARGGGGVEGGIGGGTEEGGIGGGTEEGGIGGGTEVGGTGGGTPRGGTGMLGGSKSTTTFGDGGTSTGIAGVSGRFEA